MMVLVEVFRGGDILNQERREQLNAIVMVHFNKNLFHKSMDLLSSNILIIQLE